MYRMNGGPSKPRKAGMGNMSARKAAPKRGAAPARKTRELPPGGRKPAAKRPMPRNQANTAGRGPAMGQPSARRPGAPMRDRTAGGRGRTRPMPARRPMPGRKPGMR